MNKHNDILPRDVLLRPEDYIINGTIEEIASFLEGYYSGKYAHRLGFENEAAWWPDFCKWALMKISSDKNETGSYHDLSPVLHERYGNDKTIREVVLRLMDDYE